VSSAVAEGCRSARYKTPLGQSILDDGRQGGLLAILFHLAFWQMDLSYFGRGLLGSWPQADIGIVLWSLSVSASDWQSRERLTRLCTISEPAMLTGAWDRPPLAMEARILRPLLWFGLLEICRAEFLSQGRLVRSPALIRCCDRSIPPRVALTVTGASFELPESTDNGHGRPSAKPGNFDPFRTLVAPRATCPPMPRLLEGGWRFAQYVHATRRPDFADRRRIAV
jgi:hypothetical protein